MVPSQDKLIPCGVPNCHDQRICIAGDNSRLFENDSLPRQHNASVVHHRFFPDRVRLSCGHALVNCKLLITPEHNAVSRHVISGTQYDVIADRQLCHRQ